MPDYQYFRQYEGYFWQWEDEGEVLAIPGGNTIAYKEYIADILDKLVDPGLPPFGSVLLVLIATNSEAKESLRAVQQLIEKVLGSANHTNEPLSSALAYLRKLSSLPQKYKQGKNRLLLLQTLFTDCHNRLSYRNSKQAYDSFWRAFRIDELWIQPQPFFYNLYHEEFRVVDLLSRKFPDMELLIEQLAALPMIEEEIDLEKSEVIEQEKDFIDTLIDNDRTFHVGSLVKRLWSGLNIPHHNSLPSQQPMGGVADITNKGEFHRLLISEFANEDVILLSRLANNEALYFNREVPPQNNDLERIVLIDASIKNWGTPRNIAYALLLAIAKHPKTDIACSAFVVGDRYQQVKFDTIDDIIEALNWLEPCLHPAQGLQAFLKEYEGRKNKEVFFISSAETYRQTPLHKVISDHYNFFRYWIHTDNSGGIDLYKRQQSSKKHVQHLQLPLGELWKKAPKSKPEKQQSRAAKTNYPILFPAATNPRKTMITESGEMYIVTREWNLMRRYEKPGAHSKAWEMVYEGLPKFVGDAAVGTDEKGKTMVLVFNEPDKKVTIIDIENDFSRSIVFHEWQKSTTWQPFLFRESQFVYSDSGFKGKWWTFFFNEQIVLHSELNPAVLIRNKYEIMKEQFNGIYLNSYFISTVFKNIKEVYINQVGNLVFSKRELRLTDQGHIMLEKSGFQKKEVEARYTGKNQFRFPDGSTVTVNKSGMLILQSSDPSLETIYVPSAIDVHLGMATVNLFTGNEYYCHPSYHTGEPASTRNFWKQVMTPFIETIKDHGA